MEVNPIAADLHDRRGRTTTVRTGTLLIALAVVLAGCGSSEPSRQPTRGALAATAGCAPEPLSAAPLPQESGVYRAGPVILAVGEDLAQLPHRQLTHPDGSETIAVLMGARAAVLSVDRESQGRFSLQFGPVFPGHPHAVIADGRAAVRFPACSQRLHRFGGGILFAGDGCARLHVRPAGQAPIPMLIPIGNTLRGCGRASAQQRLTQAALPFLGVACHVPNSIACDRVGIGVRVGRPAILVTVEVAGRLVTLTPPANPPGDLWLGYLLNAGLRHGALDVHPTSGHMLWFGSPGVYPRVRVTTFFANGTYATLAGVDFLHPGFG